MRRNFISIVVCIFFGVLLGLAWYQEQGSVWIKIGDSTFTWIPAVLGIVIAFKNLKLKNVENIKNGTVYYLILITGFLMVFLISGNDSPDWAIGLGFIVLSIFQGMGIFLISVTIPRYLFLKVKEENESTTRSK